MTGHPPPAIIQPSTAPFLRVGLPGRKPEPRYFVCGLAVNEADFYIVLADWMRDGAKATCKGPSS